MATAMATAAARTPGRTSAEGAAPSSRRRPSWTRYVVVADAILVMIFSRIQVCIRLNVVHYRVTILVIKTSH